MADHRNQVSADLERLRAYWNRRARSRLPDLEKLEWTARRTQRLRFDAFLDAHDLGGKSVLDVGCGLGDFYAHIRRRGLSVEYTGYDLSEGMIELCRARYHDQRFECGNFLDYRPPSRFDYTVAFGIHNIIVPHAREILELVTRHQFDLSATAAHVNLLTDRFTLFAPHIQAWPVEDTLTMALEITPLVTLNHGFLDTDFSVTLLRKPLPASSGAKL